VAEKNPKAPGPAAASPASKPDGSLKNAAAGGWALDKSEAPASLGALGDVTLHRVSKASLGDLSLKGDGRVSLPPTKVTAAPPQKKSSPLPMVLAGVGLMVVTAAAVVYFSGSPEAKADAPAVPKPRVDIPRTVEPPAAEKQAAPVPTPVPVPPPAVAQKPAPPPEPEKKEAAVKKPAPAPAEPKKSGGGLGAAFGQFGKPPPAEAPVEEPKKGAAPEAKKEAAPPPAPEPAPAEPPAAEKPAAEKPAEPAPAPAAE
jgi:hypothetical protein